MRESNGGCLVIIGFAMGLIALCIMIYRGTEEGIEATVLKAERVTKGDSSYYLVFTDKGPFSVKDSLVHLRFNSSEVYGNLAAGKTYVMRVVGWRIPLFSAYRNIIEAHEKSQ